MVSGKTCNSFPDNNKSYILAIFNCQNITLAKISKTSGLTKKNQDNAKALGVKIAELGKSLQVDRIVFDRGAHKYHGVVAMVADGAREGGLQF